MCRVFVENWLLEMSDAKKRRKNRTTTPIQSHGQRKEITDTQTVVET